MASFASIRMHKPSWRFFRGSCSIARAGANDGGLEQHRLSLRQANRSFIVPPTTVHGAAALAALVSSTRSDCMSLESSTPADGAQLLPWHSHRSGAGPGVLTPHLPMPNPSKVRMRQYLRSYFGSGLIRRIDVPRAADCLRRSCSAATQVRTLLLIRLEQPAYFPGYDTRNSPARPARLRAAGPARLHPRWSSRPRPGESCHRG